VNAAEVASPVRGWLAHERGIPQSLSLIWVPSAGNQRMCLLAMTSKAARNMAAPNNLENGLTLRSCH
jgi:hypothetical protein